MNDFTKEELEFIHEGLRWSGIDDPYDPIPERLVPIMNKIQSMIDNYCEHNYIGGIKDCSDCCVSEYRCNKCGYITYQGLE